MYNVCGDVTPASQEGAKWANYTITDLGHDLYGTLSNQIVTQSNTSYYAIHNLGTAASYQTITGNSIVTAAGEAQSWRPVLELIP